MNALKALLAFGLVLVMGTAAGAGYTQNFDGYADLSDVSNAGWTDDSFFDHQSAGIKLRSGMGNPGGCARFENYPDWRTWQPYHQDHVYAFVTQAGQMDITTGSPIQFDWDAYLGGNAWRLDDVFLAVQMGGGSWYVGVQDYRPLLVGGTYVACTYTFDAGAAQWRDLTLDTAPGTPWATIGAGAAADLSGDLIGAGLVFLGSTDDTYDFRLDNFVVTGQDAGGGPIIPEPATVSLLAMGGLGVLVRRRRK